MQFEPAFNLAVVLVIGLGSVYIWYVIALASIGDRVFAYPREHWGPLWGCPWCAGFWITGLLLIVSGTYDPLTHLACAGLCGLLGSLSS